MKFSAKQDFINKLNIEYGNKNVIELNEVNSLGMTLDNMISSKKHTETIRGKLNKVCYIVRKSEQYLSTDALKMVYYVFFPLNSVLWLDFFGVIQFTVCVFLNCGKELLE
jgi:hypothetical protein